MLSSPYHPLGGDNLLVDTYYLFVITMQKVPYRNPENAVCVQYKVDLLEEEVKGG
jgi:hypothetical protein